MSYEGYLGFWFGIMAFSIAISNAGMSRVQKGAAILGLLMFCTMLGVVYHG